MAGVKGRSGGPRPNSGGARPGAGRKPKEPEILALAATYDDPERFLRAVMNDSATDAKIRVDAAKALMPYIHAKKGEGGKKEQKQAEAQKVASRFAPGAPPKLVAAGGKKV
jgi:phage terminase small subunit